MLVNYDDEHAVGGCSYKSQMDLSPYTYVILNGTRLNRTSHVTPLFSRVPGEYRFVPFKIRSYLDSGEYRCGVDVPQRMLAPVTSNSTFIKINGKENKINQFHSVTFIQSLIFVVFIFVQF